MKKMLLKVEQEEISTVIVYKLDRLSRSVIDTYNLVKLFQDHDCKLIAIMDQLNIDTANGRMFVGMLSIIAQWEREVISERTIDGLLAKTEQGKYPCAKSPFGWTKNEDSYLHLHSEQAEWIRETANHLIHGATIQSCCESFQKTFYKPISPDYLTSILKSKRLIGILPYQGKEIKGIIPPILTENTFKELQDALHLRAPKNIHNSNFIFRNKVFCAECGKRLRQTVTNKPSIRYYYYYCPNCKKRINQSILFEQVLDPLLLHFNNLKLNSLELDLKKAKSKLDQQYLSLVTAYQNEEMSLDNFLKSSEKVLASIKEIELKNTITEKPIKVLLNASSKSRNDLLKVAIERIVVDLDTKKVVDLQLNGKKQKLHSKK